jgi:hypothetical protein
MNATVQSISSIVRQAVAILAFIFGIITQAVSSIHLPTAISGVMAAVGAGILAVEHYVADPSTGSTAATTTPVPVSTPPVPAAPVQTVLPVAPPAVVVPAAPTAVQVPVSPPPPIVGS